ncbi:MAG: type II toxin-antitoxin system PemK/MazF family toxin [Planctomycetes bacterium]|nr:type II toxin-antitoxin system PemK/MazF family toxin [Planctomycetota bacterium]
MRRGEVYLAALEPRSGSEQRGRRPVLVVSHDAFNETPAWRCALVVPITTSAFQARRGPTAVPIPRGVGGLDRDSTVLCHQVTTLDRAKLLRRIGLLADPFLARVGEGLRFAMDL